ncbi:MAG: hypothetical protein ABIA04_03055 [Pseudomonadota bacterium]
MNISKLLILFIIIFSIQLCAQDQIESSEDLPIGEDTEALTVDDLVDKSPLEEIKFSLDELSVFLDCSTCDFDYIREQIDFVSYVRNRQDANIYILVTSQECGSGTQMSIEFIGQDNFNGDNFPINYFIPSDASDEKIRSGLVEKLKLGLIPYAMRTSLSEYITGSYNLPELSNELDDKWDSWVFSIGLSGNFSAEQIRKSFYFKGSAQAQRITEKLKTNFIVSGNVSKSITGENDEQVESEYLAASYFNLMVWSVGKRWAVGQMNYVQSSTYSNYNVTANVGPAVEFNVFPYSEANRRQFTFLYSIMATYNNYIEETLYYKKEEFLLKESLTISLSIIEKWGTISLSLVGSNYFHDFSKYRLSAYPSLDINVAKGLTFGLSGSVSAVHDQLNLPMGDITSTEMLLDEREAATTWEAAAYLNITFSFGSPHNNVVNPRFGNIY